MLIPLLPFFVALFPFDEKSLREGTDTVKNKNRGKGKGPITSLKKKLDPKGRSVYHIGIQ
jgi:hypothetical protein